MCTVQRFTGKDSPLGEKNFARKASLVPKIFSLLSCMHTHGRTCFSSYASSRAMSAKLIRLLHKMCVVRSAIFWRCRHSCM